MKNLHFLIALALGLSTAAACGDNLKLPDAGVRNDAAVIPPAPTLGTVIDRMGRPAVNTALIALLDSDPLKTAKKDAYNHASLDPTSWGATILDANAAGGPRTILGEANFYLGVFDTLDQGGTITGTTAGGGGGCGNGALFNNPAGSFYLPLATVLSDDELYVDTTKTTCNNYLSVEFDAVAGTHSQCGGRTPLNDVIDSSYSFLAAGAHGFTGATFTPLVGDGVVAHTDVSESSFPFLGTPH